MTTSRSSSRPAWLNLYPLYQWLVYVPLIVLATLVGALLAVPLALLVSPRLANLWVAVPWGRVLTWLVPVRVEVEGLEHIDAEQSYVVVANHQSQFDIPVIYGWIGLDLRWVAKAELSRIPFVAAGCRAIGHIFIDRADPDQARKAINRAVGRLKAGTGLMFFAEGTRSRTGELLPFKKGAFRVAIDQQLPILPVTVVDTREILPARSLRIRPGRVRMIVHAPMETAGLSHKSSGELRRRCHSIVAGALPQGSAA
ncbi:lysophospholipid acyltransferase family protein [Wenzhouxiangella sediminis]|uniref:1-acyl-sn-glycerol-3-phosphate acyltransferase n=1 Tax=Wenzhouxiangella sediminis TaxID=1792836 RepID=A0A3E1KBC1_9GAMM|nr:lysophospholipid acyltransferase family protein [Wenzhouxiangella sediminis]RFF31920.1 1-acyl-sn-glycerol-3-phosphate acyltransferase [Wenzhouxiangella sediminis]